MVDIATLVVTDDEVAAISALLKRRWQVPLRTVDAGDAGEMAKSAGRGLRSLGLRGMRTELPLDPEVAPLDSVVGRQPNLFMSSVDAESRVDPDSPWLLGWLIGDSAVGVTVLPDGTYLVEPTTARDLLQVVAVEFLAATAEQLALLVTREGASVSPGLIRSGDSTGRIAPGAKDAVIEPVELTDSAAVVAELKRQLGLVD